VDVLSKFYFILYDIAVFKNNAMKLATETGLRAQTIGNLHSNKYGNKLMYHSTVKLA
jgi:hypothetical protein